YHSDRNVPRDIVKNRQAAEARERQNRDLGERMRTRECQLQSPSQIQKDAAITELPAEVAAWFARRGWQPRAHQLALIEASKKRRSTLLIAPTGAGKTLAGFLPSLTSISSGVKTKKAAG